MIIRRFGIWSVAKIFGAIYGTMGLIFGFFFALFALLGASFAAMAQQSGGEEAVLLNLLFGVGAIVALPVFYGLIGMIGGAITAAFYNLFARMVGGVKIEVEEEPAGVAV
ncbi:MAG TPA: hypothetical protein VLV83_24900 [Acidobacteriota bacterium]|nr:hypothetical protein [Acidobacteriota bacterium]